ncbi:MAG: prepilin-type N-terminal cleavage/methylation domain-containing protein [bacterium]|nr:prepilin-type N-terminal cleavage/methylation domain-containing protein [bacterium]
MKKNNKGFSLVELLVSIVILGIIMIPILDNIVVATRMNMKSRQVADVTVLASNIMESVKVEGDLSSMAQKLLQEDKSSYLDLFTGEDTSETEVMQVEKKAGEYVEAEKVCIVKGEDGTYTFEENANATYEFAAKKLRYNDQVYNAIIRYDGKEYKTTKDESGKDINGINSEEIPVLPTVSSEQNAVISCGYSDKWAESTLKHSFNQWYNTSFTGTNEITNSTIGKSMSRSFTVTVDIQDENYVVEAKVVYTLDSRLIYKIGSVTEEECQKYRTYENTLFKKEFKELENIYLFYTPNMNKQSDTVTLINNLPKEKAAIQFYLVGQKQKAESTTEVNQDYELHFNLEEANCETTEGSTKKYHTIFRNNLDSELGITPTITSNIDSLDQLTTGTIVNKEESKIRLYEVTVEIYQMDETKPFDKKNLLTSISSTKGEE